MDKLRFSTCLLLLLLVFAAHGALAAGSDVPMEPAEIELDNVSSLQRGARNFMNYCSGCHSAQYVRYNTIGKALELSEDQLVNNLMFNAEKTFETIRSAMAEDDAQRWFGVAPPDMSLIARAKGTDYLYNFLKGFYLQEESPTGVDNLYLQGTSMPHVLGNLQGFQAADFIEHTSEDGITTREFQGFEQVTAGHSR